MPRQRPDPAAAGARLDALLPTVGGWVPPPELPTVEPEEEPAVQLPAEPAPVPAAAGTLAGLIPVGLRGGRWDPGRPGTRVLAGVAVLAALVAGVVLVRGRPHEVAAPASPPAGVRASVGVATSGGTLVVDVAGRVRRPGVVRLPFGARVEDALKAAGGRLPGVSLDSLNLARKLVDGEQVVVGAAASGGGPAGGSVDALVDLNAADAAALDALPGIGPVLAQKIVDWRTAHGRFASVDQLREVGGIGESKFAALKAKVRV